MIDTRDAGEIAAIELIRHEQTNEPLPLERINLVGAETLSGADVAAVWSQVLGRLIVYRAAYGESSRGRRWCLGRHSDAAKHKSGRLTAERTKRPISGH